MVNRVSGPARPARQSVNKPSAPKGSFSLDPAAPTAQAPRASVAKTVGRLVSDLEHQRREIDRVIRQASGGRAFSPGELLVLQAKVYTFNQQMEAVSRMVDKAVSTVKTTLNTQV